MRTIYKCDICELEFSTEEECHIHEKSHFSKTQQIVYEIAFMKNEDVCDYCDNSYYVYGCERDCEHGDCSWINGYKEFQPVKPLHNKRAHGGV